MAWDPVAELTDEERGFFGLYGARRPYWEERLWTNVPGPFYTRDNDNCWTGRIEAPDNVLYEGAWFTEYVFRQPRNPAQVRALARAAGAEVTGGYACDGDERWTPDLVREWWAGRGRVEEDLSAALAEFRKHSDEQNLDAALGVRDYRTYLAGALADDLRAYLFRLEEGRYPEAGERLPQL
ncbi:ferredoxin [Streptomyces sp. NBC_00193]|uniref:ferredoxin n=1 Tax=unclassified Streptomyces TaxID=2593676 RepID=UPI002258D97B|nr:MULTISPECIES: ferredoxin [unclassified Streptomyces]MCX5124808.1 ferredoxin [Streptomyces sp. NBC_00347]MCX5297996.1 ferredoxin [Streptomyces sp. NBC_00193]